LQGQDDKDVDQLANLHPEQAKFDEKEQALLEYVKVLTLEPANVRDTHVERLRKLGWTDEQVFEASFITSLFAFFNRMADAYGLEYPATGWLPEELRPAKPAAAAGPKPPTPEVVRK
jgi:alkylhydroperoxidase family enzyme